MARVKLYESNAEKQAAYRARRAGSSVKKLEALAGVAADLRFLSRRVGGLQAGVLLAVVLSVLALVVSLGRGKR